MIHVLVLGAGTLGGPLLKCLAAQNKYRITCRDSSTVWSSAQRTIRSIYLADNVRVQEFSCLDGSDAGDFERTFVTFWPSDTEKAIIERNFNGVEYPTDIMREFPEVCSLMIENNHLWGRTSLLDRTPSLAIYQEVHSLLADRVSRSLFHKLISWRAKPSHETYPSPTQSSPQYFAAIEGLWASQHLRVVDVGAFNGDSLRSLIDQVGSHSIDKYWCFEPEKTTTQNYVSI